MSFDDGKGRGVVRNDQRLVDKLSKTTTYGGNGMSRMVS